MKMKKILKSVTVVALAGIVGYSGTSAYFTSFDKTTNTVIVGHNDSTIEEEFPPITPTPIENNPSYTKKVWVANKGNSGSALVDCYVRVELSYSNADIGKAVVLDNLNRDDWTYDNGFYYYNKVLKKDESTTPLITGFHIDSSKVDPKYKDQIADFEINVYEESVQAKGFSNPKEAFAHFNR